MSSTDVTFVQLRFDPDEIERLDRYRRSQSNPPTRSKAAQELIQRALSGRVAATDEVRA
jgi:hypothetical protein